jgi:hypothetical protein
MRGRWPEVVGRAVVALVLMAGLAGCPETQLCGEGLTRCGRDCVDLTAETANCGACGVSCGRGQVCNQGQCECRPGTTLCDGACVTTTSDAVHCGGCAGQGGTTCTAGQVCEQGQCKTGCALGTSLRCGDSCVNVQTDPQNCGACGNACGNARSCRGGVCTYDVVAACFNTGQVVGLLSGVDIKGPNVAVGTNPQSVDRMQDVLLVLDAATKLRQVRLTDYGALPEENTVGSAPNQVVVREPYVYIISSATNSLQVLRRDTLPAPTPTNGTRFPEGIELTQVATLDLGGNTNPWAMAVVDNELYITLFGNLLSSTEQGGKVARVSVSNPAQPQLVGMISLPTGQALNPYPGQTTRSTPTGITTRNGRLYVALNNLDPATYAPGGPGLLARIEPATSAVELIELPGCLNPGWVAPVGERLVVSCGGRATYDASYNLVGVEQTGLVLLNAQDQVVNTLALACPQGGSGCALPSAGRFAVVGSRVYVGDNNAGRLFTADVEGDRLVTQRWPGSEPQPLHICPRGSGPSFVGDVVALP